MFKTSLVSRRLRRRAKKTRENKLSELLIAAKRLCAISKARRTEEDSAAIRVALSSSIAM